MVSVGKWLQGVTSFFIIYKYSFNYGSGYVFIFMNHEKNRLSSTFHFKRFRFARARS
jgi:hypothetical protein